MKPEKVRPLENTRMTQLENQLNQSAFRHGTSAFRFGLILEAPSDHLPISAFVNPSSAPSMRLMSWNLLADSHLYNNFMNITGSHLLAQEILQSGQENLYVSKQSNMLYHFFSELSQFLYKTAAQNTVRINEKILREFIKLSNQPSRLTRSRNPETAKQKEKLAQISRQQIIDLMLNSKHQHHADFKLAIEHSLELVHHILSEQGALKWKNRFTHIMQNQKLLREMHKMDFICLQECTSPKDMIMLLNHFEERFGLLSHQTDPRSDDHCAILFDQQKFVLETKINYAIEGKKPAIFARFHPKGKPEQAFIVASIHYPGGNHHLMKALQEQIDALKKASDEKIEFFMLGDFNHTEDFFEESKTHNIVFPNMGTMAGSDYGNTNEAIDALTTNIDKNEVDVGLMQLLPTAAPAKKMLNIEFSENVAPNTAGLFGYATQRAVETKLAEVATQLFGGAKTGITVEL